jgi:hypothetical protein
MSGNSAPQNEIDGASKRTDYAWLQSQRQAFEPHSEKY